VRAANFITAATNTDAVRKPVGVSTARETAAAIENAMTTATMMVFTFVAVPVIRLHRDNHS